jgi:hypothetical protein
LAWATAFIEIHAVAPANNNHAKSNNEGYWRNFKELAIYNQKLERTKWEIMVIRLEKNYHNVARMVGLREGRKVQLHA